jgi:choline dehydrogenase-like flavoprotein
VALDGLEILAKMYFAAGAKKVLPFVYGAPTVLNSVDEVSKIRENPHSVTDFSGLITHLMGTARMGEDPKRSVVGTDFQCHDVKGLYITDSSVFPTNLGVNPQHTIMAMTRQACRQMVN